MKLLGTGLVVLAASSLLALGGCRHRDGKTANDPAKANEAYEVDAGASEHAPIPRYQAPTTPGAPAPSVTAQPGDVQL